MLGSQPVVDHIELHRISINLKFPCKVFLVVAISCQNKELKKIQTKSVDLANNEAIFEETFSLDIVEPALKKRRCLELQFSLFIQTKNGVKQAGRATDSFSPEVCRVQRILAFEKCPDKEAVLRLSYHSPNEQNPLDRSKVTTTVAALDYVQENKLRSLLNDKSRLQSQLSLVELQNYEKDIVIKNLNLQLRLKSEQNKYLFTAEKIKEISVSYQQDLKDLRKKVVDLELENKQLKREQEQAKKELEAIAKQSSQSRTSSINNFSKMLARLERSLETYVGEVNEVLDSEHRDSEQADILQQTVTRQLGGFERAIISLRTKFAEATARCSEYEKQLKQNQDMLKEMGEQLDKKRKEKKESDKLAEELREQLKSKSKTIEDCNRTELQELKKLRQENSELNSTTKQLRALVGDLQSSNERGIQAQNRLKELIQEQQAAYQDKISNFVKELQKWKGVQLESINSHIEREQQLEKEVQQLRESLGCLEVEKLCLEQQRKQHTAELRQNQEEIEQLQGKLREEQQAFIAASAKSKQFMREISNTNINIAESYNKLKLESDYRLNEERAEMTMLRIELEDVRTKSEAELQDLRRRLTELHLVERETVNLAAKLGYSEHEEHNLEQLVNHFELESESKIQLKLDEISREHRQAVAGEASRLKKGYDRIQSSLSQLQGLVSSSRQ